MRFWAPVAVLSVLLGIGLILMYLHPPRQLVMAAGPSGGAYAEIAGQYQAELARDNIQLRIIETAGSVENAHLLDTGQVDVALIQGGVALSDPTLEAIGSVFFEPMMFLTHRDGVVPTNPALWKGLRINSGTAGSGIHAAFIDLERAVGLAEGDNIHLDLRYDVALAALARGDLDIAVFVAPIDAPYLVEAFRNPAIHLMPLTYAEAISRRLEYANAVTLPAGAISLNPVKPLAAHRLLALEARLAIDPDIHPALVNRLTMAAIKLHQDRDVITDQGQFPSIEVVGMQMNTVARQLIDRGQSFWHDWLPYWLAAQVNRMFLLMLPILFILVPILRLIPMVYAYAMRWRVWQYYPEIRQIENELADGTTDLAEIDSRLIALDDRLSRIRLPAAYRQPAYDARLHIELVRKRIATIRSSPV